MKKLGFIYLFFSLVILLFAFTPSFTFASAAEKWEYDVIPDQSQRLQIKGHKVDQYGNAVNDYEYNTKIDPKTTANKQKMGTVGFGRLLKTTGWGLLGSAALEALLEAVDWVIDPEAQSIWRNKPNQSPSVSCSYKDSGGKYVIFQIGSNQPDRCPLTAVENFFKDWGNDAKFVKWKTEIRTSGSTQFEHTYKNWAGNTLTDVRSVQASRDPDQSSYELPTEKEYLTPEQLADYANKTHQDYSNPELAPKLDPKYKPSIQTDLWKPSNKFEEENSPTVQEVKKQLENSSPEPKTDPELTPNPETGGTILPSFCTWAVSVCEYFKWAKQEPELDEPLLPMKELDVKEINKELIQINSSNCPSDISVNWDGLPFGISINQSIAMQPYCDKLEPLKYVFQLITFVLCVMILARI